MSTVTKVYLIGNALIVLGVLFTFGIGFGLIAAGGVIVAHARWKGQ